MTRALSILPVAAGLLGGLVSGTHVVAPAFASGFTAFAEDEDACRHVGTAAIKGASGPTAANRYDAAYRSCMVWHGRSRQMRAYADEAQDGRGGAPNGGFPDAFYSIPYATPGYGYDGFSY